jgi:hypothetical protein
LAQADLPNGYRLSNSIGGVRVQHPYAGVYVGEIMLTATAEFQGQQVRSDCVGSLDFVVGVEGEQLTGDGGCTLALPFIGTFDLSYGVSGGIEDTSVDGTIAIDAVITSVPIPWTGSMVGDDQVEGGFVGSLFNFELVGSLSGRRVTQYVEAP